MFEYYAIYIICFSKKIHKNHKKMNSKISIFENDNLNNSDEINNNNSSRFLIDPFIKLKDKKSNPITNSLYKYINQEIPLMIEWKYFKTIDEISVSIQDFLLKKTYEFSKIWNIQFDNNKYAFIEIAEAFENLTCKSLYNVIMNLENNDKTERNNIILNKFNFLNLKYLQVNIIIEEFEFQNKLKSKNKLFLNYF